MQAVFLNNKTCERVHPVRIRKDNPDAEPFYEGMDEPLREIHDIWIMQYLRVDGAYFPRIAFEANEDENIEFDSNQEYEILSRKTDGYTYFIPENFNIYTVGDAQFFYRKNGKKQKIRIHVASMLDGKTYEKILKELTAISIRFLYMTMNDGKNRRIKREYLTEYELEIHQLEHTIKEMSETLKALDREPVTDMISRPARQNFRQVKHLDANVIMDHYVLKKPKVRTRVHEKTFHIYENQKVYNFVKLLEKRLWALEQELENDGMYLEEVLSLLKSSITNLAESQGKTLNLTYEYQKNFYTSSHYALLSIFRNLFVNALEASKTDTVNLSVTEVIEDGQAIFTVTDDGPGIPAEYIGEVFKTGFSTKINFQTGEVSRGLGLNLVQDLVEGELHGTIGLTSIPGRTAFTICIPLNELEVMSK